MLLAWSWSWLHDFVERAVSYLSYLHYVQLSAETQLRVDLGLDLLLAVLLIYIGVLLSAILVL